MSYFNDGTIASDNEFITVHKNIGHYCVHVCEVKLNLPSFILSLFAMLPVNGSV